MSDQQWTPERMQELLGLAKEVLEKRYSNSEKTIEEDIAHSAFNLAAETVIDRDQPGEFRNPEDVPITNHLQAQTSVLLGIGQLLEAILAQMRKK